MGWVIVKTKPRLPVTHIISETITTLRDGLFLFAMKDFVEELKQ